jgi:hypothetical protein
VVVKSKGCCGAGGIRCHYKRSTGGTLAMMEMFSILTICQYQYPACNIVLWFWCYYWRNWVKDTWDLFVLFLTEACKSIISSKIKKLNFKNADSLEAFQKVKTQTIWPTIFTFRYIPKKMKTVAQAKTCTQMFMAALFIIAQKWKHPKMSVSWWTKCNVATI